MQPPTDQKTFPSSHYPSSNVHSHSKANSNAYFTTSNPCTNSTPFRFQYRSSFSWRHFCVQSYTDRSSNIYKESNSPTDSHPDQTTHHGDLKGAISLSNSCPFYHKYTDHPGSYQCTNRYPDSQTDQKTFCGPNDCNQFIIPHGSDSNISSL